MSARVSTPQELFSEVVLCSARYPFFHCGGSPEKEAYDPQLTTATPTMWVTHARRVSHARPASDTRPASHSRPASQARLATHALQPALTGCKQTWQTSRSRGEPGQGSSQDRRVSHTRLASNTRPASHSRPARQG
jgi:hypothetical protein